MSIAGNEPVFNSGYHTTRMSSSRVDIPEYFSYSNFDPDAEQDANLCSYMFLVH